MKFSNDLTVSFFTSRAIHSILSILLIFLLFACSENSNDNTVDLPSDSTISETVQAQLESTLNVPADSINIGTTDGIVKLNGSIDNLLAKRRATDIAEDATGVISVINNLKVTVDRPDDAINKDVGRALNTDPATERWEIAADVNNGKVTLTGNVDSWQEKQLAGTIASRVKGVQNIENNILVSKNRSRDDSNIKAEVSKTLKFDSRIRNNLINVDVKNDTVHLSGSVGSASEKRLAIEKSHVQDVDAVEADRLEVRPEFNNERFLDKSIPSLTPKEIEEALYNTFSYDPRVPADSIKVTIEDNKTILNGVVKNLNSKIAAGKDAKNTAGINQVENNITVERKVVVKPDIPTTDKAIKSRIKNSILRNPYVEEVSISINVDKGIVELNGNVDSEFEKEQVQQITSDVKGVIAVNNNLNIKPQNE